MPARIHGFGRNSYHVAETLQRGLVPIHVYSDRPWLPYERIFESCGFATSVFGLPWLLWRLASLSDAEPAPDPACCFDCPVDPAAAGQ